ncbi:MAG: hypothetical protein ACJ757_02060 [Gaiellaceae bacterium]
MKLRIVFLLVVGACLLALPSAALGNASRTVANAVTFNDSVGEDAAAPDITSVAVSNDDAGLITFKIAISNRPTLTSDMTVLLYLDTDQKPTTGDASFAGTDYVIELDPGSVSLFQWNGSDYVAAPSQSSLIFAYDASGATIKAGAVDLGKTKGFNFVAIAISGIALDASGNPDFTNIHADAAPDSGHGLFSYQVLTKLTLSVVAFSTVPKPARVGKSFVAGLAANESDTNGPVQSGTVACSATIGTKHVTASAHGIANGVAACSWKIPKTAKGKTIRGTITLTVQGVKVSHSFAVKIL